ncbi:MAG: UDP-glucose/GDP-mannose dehydrogenase family protein [Bacteroidetes bacterium]|nr:UDP-glucose/GDP-mannose dehydrogenase family protein [Bacteroidota bacterium]
MNISVFGIGYVGCVSLGCLAADGHFVIGVDSNESKLTLLESGNATVLEKGLHEIIREGVAEKRIIAMNDYEYAVKNSEVSIICVGTPPGEDGNLDLSHIFKVAEQIGAALKIKKNFHIVSVRSSIPPGTISKIEKIIADCSKKIVDKDFSVLSNPEFLREGSAVKDYYNPPYSLIGGSNSSAMETLASIYKSVNAEVIFTDTKNAELIKFVNNSFHALKVSFANEIGIICSSLDMDSQNFMELFVKDTKLNISDVYLKPGFSYGGSCLPKDLQALQSIAEKNSLNIPLLKSISNSNDENIDRAFKLIERAKKKNIGFLGITFKAGTDDVRNSPYVSLVKKLLHKKYNVKIYDPNLDLEKVIGANKEFLFKELPVISDYLISSYKELIDEVDIVVIANQELIALKDLAKLKNKFIIDLVRIDKSLRTKDNYAGLSW